MATLRTQDLTKSYGGRTVVRGVSLEVNSGEIVGLLGPNGAGKTTTLKLLLQLVFPTSGEARIFGRPAGDVDAKRRFGYLPEQPYFYDHLTAEELLDTTASQFATPPV